MPRPPVATVEGNGKILVVVVVGSCGGGAVGGCVSAWVVGCVGGWLGSWGGWVGGWVSGGGVWGGAATCPPSLHWRRRGSRGGTRSRRAIDGENDESDDDNRKD